MVAQQDAAQIPARKPVANEFRIPELNDNHGAEEIVALLPDEKAAVDAVSENGDADMHSIDEQPVATVAGRAGAAGTHPAGANGGVVDVDQVVMTATESLV